MSTATIHMPNALVTAMRAAGHGIAATTHAALDRIGNVLTRSIEQRRREHDEAYLSEATDCFDLERRMRELDRGTPSVLSWY